MAEGNRTAHWMGLLTILVIVTGCFDEGSDEGAAGGLQIAFTNVSDVDKIQTPDITISLAGTASSDVEIETVEWTNDRGGRSNANGLETWVTGNIVLQVGLNNITITATDIDGNSTSKHLAVEREGASSSPPSDTSEPTAIFSYRSDFGSPALVDGATILPSTVYFRFQPTQAWVDRGITQIDYRCCKGISGPGEGATYDINSSSNSGPWTASADLSSLATGGVRRLRVLTHFADGSEAEVRTFDFTVGESNAPNRPPTISGNAPNNATVGVAYRFLPVGSDPDGDQLTYSIDNKPPWANFDMATGELSGMPSNSDIGEFRNIVISVSDGRATDSMSAFTLTVAPISGGSATVTWSAPTERTDNTPLNALAGFDIHYGQSSRNYSNTIAVNNPGLTTYVVNNLSAGTWYFSVVAIDTYGQESAYSAEGQIVIP